MPTNVLGTGTSALIAFQRALATVGHNVANAATPTATVRTGQLSGAIHAVERKPSAPLSARYVAALLFFGC